MPKVVESPIDLELNSSPTTVKPESNELRKLLTEAIPTPTSPRRYQPPKSDAGAITGSSGGGGGRRAAASAQLGAATARTLAIKKALMLPITHFPFIVREQAREVRCGKDGGKLLKRP